MILQGNKNWYVKNLVAILGDRILVLIIKMDHINLVSFVNFVKFSKNLHAKNGTGIFISRYHFITRFCPLLIIRWFEFQLTKTRITYFQKNQQCYKNIFVAINHYDQSRKILKYLSCIEIMLFCGFVDCETASHK